MATVRHFVNGFSGADPNTVFTQSLNTALGVLNLADILDETAFAFDLGTAFGEDVDIRAEVGGTGLTYAEGNLTGGTISSFRSFEPDFNSDAVLKTLEVTGLTLAATTFQEVFETLSGAQTVLNAMLSGNDTVLGSAGRDDMTGAAGNDQMRGGEGDDTMFGGAGKDVLQGQDGNDKLFGDAKADTLFGGDGNDQLEGGTGRDVFVFDAELGRNNVDRIFGYQRPLDRIFLDREVFEGIGNTGRLDADAFVRGRDAQDEDDRIIVDFNRTFREFRISFDADGSGDLDAQLFLQIGANGRGRLPIIDVGEFFII